MKDLLLTLDEAKPFCKTAKMRYATGWTENYVWDALGLLKAQLAKVLKIYEGADQILALYPDEEAIRDKVFQAVEDFHKRCGRQDMNELRSWQSLKKGE